MGKALSTMIKLGDGNSGGLKNRWRDKKTFLINNKVSNISSILSDLLNTDQNHF